MAQALARTLEDFLAQAQGAVILERGGVAFDLAPSKCSISGEYNKCLLHLWSPERNVVCRVLELELKTDVLRRSVQPLGQTRATRLEICRAPGRRTPAARRTARLGDEHTLRRGLHFPEYKYCELLSIESDHSVYFSGRELSPEKPLLFRGRPCPARAPCQ
jgi:hypothetical protein